MKNAAIGAGVGLLTLGLGVGAAGGALVGMNKVVCTCLACGHQWRPGQAKAAYQAPVSPSQSIATDLKSISYDPYVSPWQPVNLNASSPDGAISSIGIGNVVALLMLAGLLFWAWPSILYCIGITVLGLAAILAANAFTKPDTRDTALYSVPGFVPKEIHKCVDGTRVIGMSDSESDFCILKVLPNGAEYRLFNRDNINCVEMEKRTGGGFWLKLFNPSRREDEQLYFRDEFTARAWQEKIARMLNA